MNKKPIVYKIRNGLYSSTINGKLWFIEHVTKAMGFAYNEWHVGPEDDAHRYQYPTLKACEAILESELFEAEKKATHRKAHTMPNIEEMKHRYQIAIKIWIKELLATNTPYHRYTQSYCLQQLAKNQIAFNKCS